MFKPLILTILFSSSVFAISEGESVLTKLNISGYQSGVLNQEMMQGKVTIVNFWATWCEACKVEIKEMEDLFAKLLKNEKFNLAFVTLDKDPKKAEKWMRTHLKNPDTFVSRLYKDPEFEAADRLEVDSFPMTLVIAPDGKISYIQRGFKEGEGSTEKLVELAGSMLKG